MKTIENCPICGTGEITPFMTTKDFSVSQQVFSIVKCTACDLHFTNPIPDESKIGEYYKSESYVSHSSSNKGIINKIYLRVRSFTLKQKLKLINRLIIGKNVLDIGAGTGHFLNTVKTAGYVVTGLEPDDDARVFAKQNLGLELRPASDLNQLPEKSFDAITMWHVLEHVYHLKRDLGEINRILKPDGVLIVAVPNRASYDAQYYKEFWAAYDLPIHLYHFTPKNIGELFGQFNFEIKEILPMKFDSFYVSMLSEKYKGGNIMNAFLVGLKSNFKAKPGFYSSQIYILKRKTQ